MDPALESNMIEICRALKKKIIEMIQWWLSGLYSEFQFFQENGFGILEDIDHLFETKCKIVTTGFKKISYLQIILVRSVGHIQLKKIIGEGIYQLCTFLSYQLVARGFQDLKNGHLAVKIVY